MHSRNFWQKWAWMLCCAKPGTWSFSRTSVMAATTRWSSNTQPTWSAKNFWGWASSHYCLVLLLSYRTGCWEMLMWTLRSYKCVSYYIYACSIEPEVAPANGCTSLLEVDQQTGSTTLRVTQIIICVFCIFCMLTSFCHPKANRPPHSPSYLIDSSPGSMSHLPSEVLTSDTSEGLPLYLV